MVIRPTVQKNNHPVDKHAPEFLNPSSSHDVVKVCVSCQGAGFARRSDEKGLHGKGCS